jgi:glycosyltransferase involved in cell wall biosynthesis
VNKNTSKDPVLVLIGQTPPPYNGQTVMIEVLRAGLEGRFLLEHVRMSYSASIDEVGKPKLSKFLKLFSLIHATRKALKKHPGSILYYPPASPNLIPIVRDILYLPCVRYLAKKTVYHYHAYGIAEFLENKPLLAKLARLAYGKADLAVVPTAPCRKDPVFLRSKRIETVPYGRNMPAADLRPSTSDLGPLTPDLCPLSSDLHSPAPVLRILFVGIHTAGKGFFDLIETARELKDRDVPFHIRCAGMWAEEEERIKAEEMMTRYGLQSAITLLGNCTGDKLWQEYKNADVLFFPTKYVLETQGMVVVEAMAFSLPVVASCWRGPKDVVVDGITGFLCDPGSITAYADALTELQKSPEKRIAMGAAGRRRYEDCYTEERYIHRWMELLDEIGQEE